MELLGSHIRIGVRTMLELEVASLYTRTRIAIPVIVHNAKAPGPILLIMSGIHGDEVNGIEINRRLLADHLIKPVAGAVIHVPIANVMAFINMDRKFADGRDLNRSFPGSAKGSLASQLGHLISSEIIPGVDAVIDLHTGAEDRFNVPQIRYDLMHKQSKAMAAAFNAPFSFQQANPPTGSFRKVLGKRGIPNIIFEAGRSRSINKKVVNRGIAGVQGVAALFGIIEKVTVPVGKPNSSQHLVASHWIRASSSGMLELVAKGGDFVEKGDVLALINGPYAQFQKKVRAKKPGFVICINKSPVVHVGDALLHIGEAS